jgi:DNA mismatch endonuclease (patch repair protein)
MIGRLKPDRDDPEFRNWVMSRVRSKGTRPEMVVRKMVFSMGYRYRLHRKDLPGTPDLVLPGRRSIILVNGCFWHSHDCKLGQRLPKSNIEYWVDKKMKNCKRDILSMKSLNNLGWRVMVIWECEIKNENLMHSIRRFLN